MSGIRDANRGGGGGPARGGSGQSRKPSHGVSGRVIRSF